MPREKDPFRTYVTFLNENNSKWRCNFCEQENGGGAQRIKAHLAGIGGFGIKGCDRVDVDVRADAKAVLMAKRVMDSSDRGVPEDRIHGNVRAAPTSTFNPPNLEGGTNLQFLQGMPKDAPSGASSFQNDRLLDVGNSNCFLDCNQPRISSVTRVTNAVPHSNEPLPSCNEECGTETDSFPLRDSMDIYSPTALQPTRGPNEATHVDSQVLEGEATMASPSSSQELGMNMGAPMMSHPNTGNNFEEKRALKRKLELLYRREASIRAELIFAEPFSLKKLRMEIVNLLAIVDKCRNDCTEAASEEVGKLMRAAEDSREQGKGLFEARETKVSKLLEGKMVGEAFQRNTAKILEYLAGNQVSQLGIYGMGGVGKTTIMVHIHNRLLEKANRGNVLWITVSKDFNTKKLQEDIWMALGLDALQENDVRKRAAMLSDCFTKRGKSTIILDDVWEYIDLEEVGIPIRTDGFKLVLTTRSLDVCCQMQCQEKIKIEPLSQKEAEILFLEELGSEVPLNLEIEAIVKTIVKECAGLPLGVITIARSMRGVAEVFIWKNALVKLRESDMGQTNMEKKVLMNLKFSYDRLDNHEVQQCFLSCALYPEDELIDKFELIELFIDQGLIDRLHTREEQYDRGLTILNILENACLSEDHGSKMKMHDLIRDMALHIMSVTSLVKAGKGLMGIPLEEYWTDALEKVSLMRNVITEFPFDMSPNCPKLSTLLLNNSLSWNVVIPDSFFRQLQGLKVLNLSGCHLQELPNSISDLVNLRALLLSRCVNLCHIPHLGKLRSLRKLVAVDCFSLEMLEGLEMLVNLRCLRLDNTRIKRLPEGTLGGLRNLQFLSVYSANGEDITKLRALKTLHCYFEDVDDFNKCVGFIKQSNPRYYNLEVNQEESSFDVEVRDDARFGNWERIIYIHNCSHKIVSVGGEHTSICILIPQDVQKLEGRRCDGTTKLSNMGSLENLECLFIKEWKKLQVLCGGQDEEVVSIHGFPAPAHTPLLFQSLRVLNISRCPNLKYLFGHGSKFFLPNLREIEIYDCEEMVGITTAVTSLPSCPTPAFPSPTEIEVQHYPLLFPSLRVLKISRCLNLKYLFGHVSKLSLPELQEIQISNCKEMVGIIAVVTSRPPCPTPAFPSLTEIAVEECNTMRRVVESEWLPHFPNMRTIKVHNCENMEGIIGGPPPYMLVEKISLESLKVYDCHNMRMLLPYEWLLYLQNLQSISVNYCTEMVEMISRVGQGQEGSIMTPVNNNPPSFQISLPNLKSLTLLNLSQLKSICEVPITCYSMEHLKVYYCPKLNRIPLQLPLRDIEHLPYIDVEDEEKWKSLMWDDPNAQAILPPYHRKESLAFEGVWVPWIVGESSVKEKDPWDAYLEEIFDPHGFLQTQSTLPYE